MFAPAQLIRRLSRPVPPSELPCGSLSRPFPKVSIRPSGQPSVSLSRACPGARLSFPYSPSAAVSSARETDHGLPGLAVKNETDASSLVEVCFLIATFVQRMRPRAQLCKFCLKNSVCWQVLLPVNPKNPAILSRERIGTDSPSAR